MRLTILWTLGVMGWKVTCCELNNISAQFTLNILNIIPAGINLLKVNNRNTWTRCEICSKLTIKIPERRCSGMFIVNFEHILHLVWVFLLLTLNMWSPAGLFVVICFNLFVSVFWQRKIFRNFELYFFPKFFK